MCKVRDIGAGGDARTDDEKLAAATELHKHISAARGERMKMRMHSYIYTPICSNAANVVHMYSKLSR